MNNFISILSLVFFIYHAPLQAQVTRTIKGVVQDAENRQAIAGATIEAVPIGSKVKTNNQGLFEINVGSNSEFIVIRSIGYQDLTLAVATLKDDLLVYMKPSSYVLEEVEVSTGYQQIPKERATGSFVQIDNDLLNRSVSTDIVSRLKGVVPSMLFDERGGGEPKLSIRGRSTIFANDQPLIVLDNFPYDGDINNINPNDIETITILKDAAAASIWGVRAGNGVIVITSKKGRNNQPLKIGFNANSTIGNKPDLFYQPQISSADFIEIERMLFDNKHFDTELRNTTTYPALSPIVELLAKNRETPMDPNELERLIDEYKKYDVRDDILKYFYRNSFNQQYSFNVSGGGRKHNYYYSTGYDKNRSSSVGNDGQRVSVATLQNIYPIDKLNLSFGLDYVRNDNTSNNALSDLRLGTRSIYPYARLADEFGQPLAITNKFRGVFLEESLNKGLLDWSYKPLEELDRARQRSMINTVRLQAGAVYDVYKGLQAEFRYQYQQQNTSRKNEFQEDAFFVRDLVNRYTTFPTNGIKRNVPIGGILHHFENALEGHNGRFQMNYSADWKRSNFHAIGGIEVRQIKTTGHSSGKYGYDFSTGVSGAVNYDTYILQYPSGNSLIPEVRETSGTVDRFRSYYSNVAYSFDSRYTISMSGRIDQSNLFGVAANQRAVPLWSVGGKWKLSDEAFYRIDWLPNLQLKATYGYQGNLDNTVTAYTTARMANDSFTGLPRAWIISPPNPNLKWEKISMLNLGLEFVSKDQRISGSFEYYKKKSQDLIGEGPLGITSGMSNFKGNVADMKGQGIDLVLQTSNLIKKVKWNSVFQLSYSIDEITNYKLSPSSLTDLFFDKSITRQSVSYSPVEGKPLFGVYSYHWAGLDSENGNPMGYLHGELSDNYVAISSMQNTKIDDLIYHGRAIPPFFGSIRNNFTFRKWSLSTNIIFSMGHFFRKPTIYYDDMFKSYGSLHADFNNRWQSPGDELNTFIPSLQYPVKSGRDSFYANSEVNIRRGGVIRLQDISISYRPFEGTKRSYFMRKIEFYSYFNNVGMLWTANKERIDPDIRSIPKHHNISAGFKSNF